jgi:hypothetical protein
MRRWCVRSKCFARSGSTLTHKRLWEKKPCNSMCGSCRGNTKAISCVKLKDSDLTDTGLNAFENGKRVPLLGGNMAETSVLLRLNTPQEIAGFTNNGVETKLVLTVKGYTPPKATGVESRFRDKNSRLVGSSAYPHEDHYRASDEDRPACISS